MATQIFLNVVLVNGVVLDASIFDDRNYVEIDDQFLANARQEIADKQQTVPESAQLILTCN